MTHVQVVAPGQNEDIQGKRSLLQSSVETPRMLFYSWDRSYKAVAKTSRGSRDLKWRPRSLDIAS